MNAGASALSELLIDFGGIDSGVGGRAGTFEGGVAFECERIRLVKLLTDMERDAAVVDPVPAEEVEKVVLTDAAEWGWVSVPGRARVSIPLRSSVEGGGLRRPRGEEEINWPYLACSGDFGTLPGDLSCWRLGKDEKP